MMTQTEEIVASKEMALDLMDVLASAAGLEAGAPLSARKAVDVAFRSIAYALVERLREGRHPGACSALARVRDAAAAFSVGDMAGGALTGEVFGDEKATDVAEDAHLAFMEVAAAAGVLARAERASRTPGLGIEGMCSR